MPQNVPRSFLLMVFQSLKTGFVISFSKQIMSTQTLLFVLQFKPGLDNNKSAWEKMNSVSILKQFGSNRVDLRLDSDEGKVMLKEALAKFLDIGVLGFRLANVKHFIISRDLKSETIDRSGKGTNATIGDYNFYTHSQSTFGAGLGDLLKEFAAYVHEKSNDEAFLSVKDQIPDLEVEKFQVKENFLFDLPLYGSIENLLIDETAADVILHKLNRTRNMVGKQQIQLPVSFSINTTSEHQIKLCFPNF